MQAAELANVRNGEPAEKRGRVMSLRFRTLALGGLIVLASADLPAQSPTLQQAMRQKLASAQALLEAVVKADYAAVARYTDPLARFSETEVASWQTVRDRDYVEAASLFLLSVKGLRQAAAEEDAGAVAAEYTTLVSTCVRCHTHARN